MHRRVTQSPPDRSTDPERLSRAVWASVGLHTALAVLLIASPWFFPANSELWGSENGGGDAISIQTVSGSGLPLPAPPNPRPDAIGNDSAGLSEAVPQPEAAAPPETAPEDAEPVPEEFEEEFEVAEAPEPEPTPPPAPPKPVPTPPAPRLPEPPRDPVAPPSDNAIPFGQGGRPDVSGGTFGNDQGAGGLEVGDGAFGSQFGTYVSAMKQKIANNWFQSMVNASVPSGSRVTLTFDILRNGNIADVRVVEPSGNPTLDESAERAISRSSPLGTLPARFSGSRISVRFWFEFRR